MRVTGPGRAGLELASRANEKLGSLSKGNQQKVQFISAVAHRPASIWFLRIAVGKIFALGMLMYGKQPGWSEVWRWLRET